MAIRRLPLNPTDGMVVSDSAGNTMRYDISTDAWTKTGRVVAIPDASTTVTGLATPAIMARLIHLKTNITEPPASFKILPYPDAYWYLLFSSNRLIKFIPESSSTLRIEFDLPRFYRLLTYYRCTGEKGPKGDKGKKGKNGTLSAETAYLSTDSNYSTISADGKRWSIKVNVPLSLDTDISVRVYNNTPNTTDDGNALVTLLIPLTGGRPPSLTASSTVDIDSGETLASVSYSPTSTELTLTFVRFSGTWLGSTWYFRAKQKGPTGAKGKPLNCLPDVEVYELPEGDNTTVTNPLNHLRLDVDKKTVYIARAAANIQGAEPVFGQPVMNIRFNPNSPVRPGPAKKLVGIAPGDGNLSMFDTTPKDVSRPQLTSPVFDPSPGCSVGADSCNPCA